MFHTLQEQTIQQQRQFAEMGAQMNQHFKSDPKKGSTHLIYNYTVYTCTIYIQYSTCTIYTLIFTYI